MLAWGNMMTLYIRIMNFIFGWEYVHLHEQGTRRVRYTDYNRVFVYRYFGNGDYIHVLHPDGTSEGGMTGSFRFEPITKCKFIDNAKAIEERKKFLGAAD